MSETQKLFVGNVPFDCTDVEFTSCFDMMKGFVSASLIKNETNGSSRGFGHVVFDTQDSCVEAMSKEINLKGRTLRLSAFAAKNFRSKKVSDSFINDIQHIASEDEKLGYRSKTVSDSFMNDIRHFSSKDEKLGYTLCISNVPENLQPSDLRSMFTYLQRGEIGACYISDGNGYVELKNRDSFDRFIQRQKIITKYKQQTYTLDVSQKQDKKSFVKTRRDAIIDTRNSLYIAGFNAGRNLGFREGLHVKTREFIGTSVSPEIPTSPPAQQTVHTT